MNQHITQTLDNLASRGIELRVQYHNENGQMKPRFQATGTGVLFAADWEKLRRHHAGIVKYLEQNGMVDQPFGEFAQDDFRFSGTQKVLITTEDRETRVRISDEKAKQSKVAVREIKRLDKAEPKLKQSKPKGGKGEFKARPIQNTDWTPEQKQYLCSIYFDKSVWPVPGLGGVKRDERREIIIAKVASLGHEKAWPNIERQISWLRKQGEIGYKLPPKKR